MGLSQFDEREPFGGYGSLGFGTSPADQSMVQGIKYGTRIDQLIFSWNGAADTVVAVRVDDGFGDVAVLGTITLVAPSSGLVTAVDVIAALLPAAQPYVLLPTGHNLVISVPDTYLGTDKVTYFAAGGNF